MSNVEAAIRSLSNEVSVYISVDRYPLTHNMDDNDKEVLHIDNDKIVPMFTSFEKSKKAKSVTIASVNGYYRTPETPIVEHMNSIADYAALKASSMTSVFAFADGCGMSSGAKKMARHFVKEVLKEMRKSFFKVNKWTSPHAIGIIIFNIISKIQNNIAQYCKDNNTLGETTLLVGCILPNAKGTTTVIYCNIGDCMLGVKSRESFTILTPDLDARTSIKNCGGRVGSFNGVTIIPDYGNIMFGTHELKINDMLLACSDGLYDNFSPINMTDSESVIPYISNKLFKLIGASPFLSDINEKLLRYCIDLNQASYNWHAKNSGRLPDDEEKYPGKQDHTTVMLVKIHQPSRVPPPRENKLSTIVLLLLLLFLSIFTLSVHLW